MSRVLPLLLLSACQYGLVPNRGGPVREPRVEFNACLAPDGIRAAGTWEDPVLVAGLPFVDSADTSDAPANEVDRWDCDERTLRAGGEVVYRLTLTERVDLFAEVVGAEGVGVMVQLLPVSGEVGDRQATGCTGATDDTLTADMLPAGEYWLVVDTVSLPNGDTPAGAYTLTVEATNRDEWQEVEVADGLTWRAKREVDDEAGTSARWNVLAVDLTKRDLQPRGHATCQPVPEAGEGLGALAGINGGFQDESCRSLDMVRVDGVTLAKNGYADEQRVLAWDDGGAPELEWVPRGRDFTRLANAVGSYPSLIDRGLLSVEPEGTDAFWTERQARTAVGVTADDELLLFTADGGTTTTPGLTLDELAGAMAELGAVEAVNLDGGAATTLWVSGCSASGTVSRPTAGGGESHEGAQMAPDGLYVF